MYLTENALPSAGRTRSLPAQGRGGSDEPGRQNLNSGEEYWASHVASESVQP